MFCEENGPTLIENVLKLAVESIRQKKYDGKSLGYGNLKTIKCTLFMIKIFFRELIEEVSRYLSTVGICEIQVFSSKIKITTLKYYIVQHYLKA